MLLRNKITSADGASTVVIESQSVSGRSSTNTQPSTLVDESWMDPIFRALVHQDHVKADTSLTTRSSSVISLQSARDSLIETLKNTSRSSPRQSRLDLAQKSPVLDSEYLHIPLPIWLEPHNGAAPVINESSLGQCSSLSPPLPTIREVPRHEEDVVMESHIPGTCSTAVGSDCGVSEKSVETEKDDSGRANRGSISQSLPWSAPRDSYQTSRSSTDDNGKVDEYLIEAGLLVQRPGYGTEPQIPIQY